MLRRCKTNRKQKRKSTEKYDKEEFDETSKKLKSSVDESPGIEIVPTVDTGNKPGVIFIIEKASLEIAKVGKNYELLSSNKHSSYLLKKKLNPADYRPDIAFQAILTILDSRVTKSGRLKALYVRTQQGVLFQINPNTHIPRVYDRFAGIIVQLLQKLKITAVGNATTLLRVIKNPVTKYLPVNSRKIGFSHSSEKLVDMYDYVGAINDDSDLVFVVGAMAHGKIENDYVEDYLSLSEYPLSAAYAITIITNAVERKWRVL